MANETTLTAERLRELLVYDPLTGVFRWRQKRCGRALRGAIAGYRHEHPTEAYWLLTIDDRTYRAHRVAWLYVHGVWPADQIDHRNGDPSDNRIANLREASCAENTQNKSRARTNNKSGFLGVNRVGPRWHAQIMVDGKKRHLGNFDTPEEASAAYISAKSKLHPFWAER